MADRADEKRRQAPAVPTGERYRVSVRVIDSTVRPQIAADELAADLNRRAVAGYRPIGWRPYDGSCVLEVYERADQVIVSLA